ncbi:MAG: hypothetical protein MUF04_08220, partial [Akkermansiaceae bacterium]|nr:hypothetical protein [Akkermansiaceae bacterium]
RTMENILGSSPAAFSQGLTAVSASTGILSFQHRLNPEPASDLSYVYEWSSDLVNWYGTGVESPGGTTVTFIAVNPLDPPDQDLFFVTATVTGSAPKIFARIKVVQN